MMNYAQQIKHPSWQKKRLEVLEDHDFKCQICGAKEEELHVHHPFYKRGAMIWEYDKAELQCLCNKCHKNIHVVDEKVKAVTSLLTPLQKLRVLGYLEAITNTGRTSKNLYYLQGYINGFSGDNDALIESLYSDYHYE